LPGEHDRRESCVAKNLDWKSSMKAAGFLLLFAGFAIALSTFVLLSSNAPRAGFVLSGIAVQVLGLVLTFRAHYSMDEGH
jgi:hypothetical protein